MHVAPMHVENRIDTEDTGCCIGHYRREVNGFATAAYRCVNTPRYVISIDNCIFVYCRSGCRRCSRNFVINRFFYVHSVQCVAVDVACT